MPQVNQQSAVAAWNLPEACGVGLRKGGEVEEKRRRGGEVERVV